MLAGDPDGGAARLKTGSGAGARDRCDVYGESIAEMVDARFPEPKPAGGPTSGVIADDGGYTGISIHSHAPLRKMRWWCDGRRLTVRVLGPWILGGADMDSALGNLVVELRERGLDAEEDGIEIRLEAELVDLSSGWKRGL